jgi:acetate kinase
LSEHEKLADKAIIVHLGSGASVTGLHKGRSVDNTMGYSPLEGLIMSTRSGSLDVTAARVLRSELSLSEHELDEYLNQSSGLLGLGGSDDIRELLASEIEGSHRAGLALDTYIYSVQKAIGAMTSALGGVDQLIFTGTVGERSAPIRQRIVSKFGYLDFVLDGEENRRCENPLEPTRLSLLAHSRPIYVVPIDESVEMVRHVLDILP